MKLKDSPFIKVVDGKVLMKDIPPFRQWCKIENLPCDSSAKMVYDIWVSDAPTMARAAQACIDNDLDKALEVLNKLDLETKNRIDRRVFY